METWLIELTKENAAHIAIINDELNQIVIRLTVVEQRVNLLLGILAFIGVSLGGLFIAFCWKKIFCKNNKQ